MQPVANKPEALWQSRQLCALAESAAHCAERLAFAVGAGGHAAAADDMRDRAIDLARSARRLAKQLEAGHG